MPRRLGAPRNELVVQDNLSGTEIVLYYRMPTTREKVNYENMSLQRKGNKVIQNIGDARRRYGFEILTGFRERDFERIGPGESWVPMSSDPKSPHYDPNWKSVVADQASDLVELLAARVFDHSAAALEPTPEPEPDPRGEAGADAGAEEDPGKNS